jgi:AcrR family transcriptional regulator
MAKPLPRWRRRKDDRPSEILAAAIDCFAERGFAATRLDDIAKRAGVTRGTLYLYFQSKEELFKAVIRQRLVPILVQGEALIADDREPTAEILRRLLHFFPQAVLGTSLSAIPKLIIAEARNFPDLARFYLDEVVARGKRLIGALVQRGIQRGEFRDVATDQIVFQVMGPLVLAAMWRHSLGHFDPGGLDPERLCRAHADLLLNGLLKHPERSS